MCDSGPRRLVGIKDFAAAAGIGVSTAWLLLKRDPRSPTPIKVRSLTRFDVRDVEAFLDLLKQEAEAARESRRKQREGVAVPT